MPFQHLTAFLKVYWRYKNTKIRHSLMDFQADIGHLGEMLAFIRHHAQKNGLSEEKIRKIELASEEALVNIISYAFPKPKINKLEIVCEKHGKNRFEVLVRDQGVPFNPIDTEIQPDLDKSIEERKVGGLGIYIIRKLVDEVSYQRVDNQNILRMVICIE